MPVGQWPAGLTHCTGAGELEEALVAGERGVGVANLFDDPYEPPPERLVGQGPHNEGDGSVGGVLVDAPRETLGVGEGASRPGSSTDGLPAPPYLEKAHGLVQREEVVNAGHPKDSLDSENTGEGALSDGGSSLAGSVRGSSLGVMGEAHAGLGAAGAAAAMEGPLPKKKKKKKNSGKRQRAKRAAAAAASSAHDGVFCEAEDIADTSLEVELRSALAVARGVTTRLKSALRAAGVRDVFDDTPTGMTLKRLDEFMGVDDP